VWLGDGAGGFGGLVETSVPGNPRGGDVGDLDGDGDVDIAVALATGNAIAFVLGDGLGGFALAGSAPAGVNPSSVVLGDLDGDGDLDAAAPNTVSNDVTIAFNDGSGTFGVTSTEAVDVGWAQYGDVGDVDADGDLDLLLSSRAAADNAREVLVNDGTGSFADRLYLGYTQAYQSGTFGDLDGDGDIDLASGNVLVDDPGSAAPVTHLLDWGDSGAGAFEHVIADVSGDGAPDLLEAGGAMILLSIARP
jgi:VCBS repeat protein